MAVTSAPLNVKNSCDFVTNSVRDSLLNYSIQETPYSLYLTIRKTFTRSSLFSDQNSTLPNFATHENEKQVETLKMRLKTVEEDNMSLKNDYEDAVDDCEQCHARIKELETIVNNLKEEVENGIVDKENVNKIISETQKKDKITEQLKINRDNLEGELEVAEKNWKELNKLIKLKDKELHDLQKKNTRLSENLVTVSADFNNLTSLVNKEKKSEAKKIKKLEKKEFMDGLTAKPVEFECSKCTVKLESMIKLKIHESTSHMETHSTQTTVKEFDDKTVQTFSFEFSCDESVQTIEENIPMIEKYPCYYCGINIVSEHHLSEHKRKCRGSSRMCGVLGLPVPRFRPPANLSTFMQPRFFY